MSINAFYSEWLAASRQGSQRHDFGCGNMFMHDDPFWQKHGTSTAAADFMKHVAI